MEIFPSCKDLHSKTCRQLITPEFIEGMHEVSPYLLRCVCETMPPEKMHFVNVKVCCIHTHTHTHTDQKQNGTSSLIPGK